MMYATSHQPLSGRMVSVAGLIMLLLGSLVHGAAPVQAVKETAPYCVSVAITRISTIDRSIDSTSAPDFYAKVRVHGHWYRSRWWFTNRYTLQPNWRFQQCEYGLYGYDVKLQLWDEDDGFDGWFDGDDHLDINPSRAKDLDYRLVPYYGTGYFPHVILLSERNTGKLVAMYATHLNRRGQPVYESPLISSSGKGDDSVAIIYRFRAEPDWFSNFGGARER